jgi:hypothetical protein
MGTIRYTKDIKTVFNFHPRSFSQKIQINIRTNRFYDKKNDPMTHLCWVTEWVGVRERVRKGGREWVGWVWVSEWGRGWMSEWGSEWGRECVSEWVGRKWGSECVGREWGMLERTWMEIEYRLDVLRATNGAMWKFSKLCEKKTFIIFLYYATNCTELSLHLYF